MRYFFFKFPRLLPREVTEFMGRYQRACGKYNVSAPSNSKSTKLFHCFKWYSWDNNQFLSSFCLLQSSFICWWICQEQVRQCNSNFNICAPYNEREKQDNIGLIMPIISHRLPVSWRTKQKSQRITVLLPWSQKFPLLKRSLILIFASVK